MELTGNNIQKITTRRRNLLLLVIIILASLPLFKVIVHRGHDLDFHLNRILAITDSIFVNPQFPHRIASNLIYGYGYASPIYYPELFLYIPAIFNGIGCFIFPNNSEQVLILSYQLYVLLVNIATTLVSYRCFSKITNKDSSAILVTAIYVLSSYRWICLYTRAAVGEYTAMVFLPIIALAVYSIYCNKTSTWYKNALLLIIGFSGLLQSHLISLFYSALLIIPVTLFAYKKAFTKTVVKTYLFSIIVIFLINAWYIIPLISYMSNFKASLNDGVSLSGSVQYHGVYLSQLFNFFGHMEGESILHPAEVTNRFQMTIGLVPFLFVLISIVLWIKCRLEKKEKFVLILSLFVLFMSTVYFPWDFISSLPVIGSLLSSIQFPWRLLGFVSVLLSILVCFILNILSNKNSFYKYCVSVSAIFVSLLSLWYSLWSFKHMEYGDDIYDFPYSSSAIGYGEYLPTNASVDNCNTVPSENVTNLSKKGTAIRFSVSDCSDGYADLPAFYYPGYQAVDSSGNILKISANEKGFVRVFLPDDNLCPIYVSFVEPILWRISEILSLCAMIGLVILIKKFQKKVLIL